MLTGTSLISSSQHHFSGVDTEEQQYLQSDIPTIFRSIVSIVKYMYVSVSSGPHVFNWDPFQSSDHSGSQHFSPYTLYTVCQNVIPPFADCLARKAHSK
ncbi:hypothetical protein T02_16141 [Trichinella nativa]|nr:hypothetical protein T02_16141 [Trichinella nativa]